MAVDSKDLLKQFKAAAWPSRAALEEFLKQAAPAPTPDLLKLLSLISDKVNPAEATAHRTRCAVFLKLAEGNPDKELFGHYVRALKGAEATARQVLVQLIPRVNHLPGHAELCAHLRSPDAALRVAAAQAIKQIFGKTAFHVLSEMVKEPQFIGRTEAMDVLVSVAKYQAIPALQSVLAMGTPAEKVAALGYLGNAELMQKDSASALKAIATALAEANEAVVTAALGAFGALASEEEFFAAAAPALDSTNVAVARAAVLALKRYGSPRAVAALERKFRMGPKVVRLAVIEALEAVGNDTVLPALAEALRHKQLEVRARAGEALSRLALAGKVELARTVMWLLRSEDANVRRMAAEIARRVGDPTGELWPRLLRYLRDEDWWVRERITDALVEMAGSQLTKHVATFLQDESEVLRRWAVEMLMRLKDPASLGLLVRTSTADTDWWVRERAIEAIAGLMDKRASPYLVEILRRDEELRLVCLGALTELKDPACAEAVGELLASGDPDVRLAALRCLGALNEPALAPQVAACKDDTHLKVRTLARELLARWRFQAQAGAGQTFLQSLSALDRLLYQMAQARADDLFLQAERVPCIKRLGKVERLGEAALSAREVEALLLPHLSLVQQQELEALRDIDFSHDIKSEGLRFRANVFQQKTGLGAVFRIVKNVVPELDKLGLPPVVRTFGELKNGLVLLGGPTGSGKSTTLAAVIDYINRTSARHIITLEDPIEVIHERKQCLINQREIGTHTRTFETALRSTLRQDPDVILVGEMRDLATIAFAVTAAETGHLVFGTVHTVSADTSVDRLINTFPSTQQPQVRAMLAESLRAVVCQHLCRRVDQEGGRVLAVEVMLNNEAVSNLIRKGTAYQIPSVVTTSRELGMQSMDSELRRLWREGLISAEEVYMKANNKKDFEDLSGAEPGKGGPAAAPEKNVVKKPAAAGDGWVLEPDPPAAPRPGARTLPPKGA